MGTLRRVRSYRRFGSYLLASLGLAPAAFSACTSDDGPGAGGSGTGGSGHTGGSLAGGPADEGGAGTRNQAGSGSGGASETSGGASQGGSAGRGLPQCSQARPLISGQETGFFRCGRETDFIHRAVRADCASTVPREGYVVPPSEGEAGAGGNSGGRECQTDHDCIEKPLGFCVPSQLFEGPFVNTCAYGCIRDEQCQTGELCLCADPVGQCVPASCETDAACADGALCASYDIIDECKVWQSYGFACHDTKDECVGSDCSGYCVDNGEHRVCEDGASGCGRPFLVDGAHRQASAVARADWAEPLALALCDDLSHQVRERVGREWLASALLEHASIASFARFTLQLLGLGAPAELVEASSRAMLDEAEHARVCFAVAGRYLHEKLGPSSLSLERALTPMSLFEICRLTLVEGCLGESVAAAVAAELSQSAGEPALRAVLNKIAGEELSHAALGFRFLGWAARQLSPSEHTRLSAEFQRAAADLVQSAQRRAPSEPSSELELLLHHGVMPEATRAEIVEAALRDMIEPCLRSVLHGYVATPGTDVRDAETVSGPHTRSHLA